MADHINFNGKIFTREEPVFTASSRAVRFGDGLFETMRVMNGKILFEELHKERLFKGLSQMRFVLPKTFNWTFLHSAVSELLQKNGHLNHARVRLMITRGDGAIMEEPVHSPQFLVETWATNEYRFEENGIKADVFKGFPKNSNAYANIKTCNFLPYAMAALFAKENKLDECLLLNEHGRICDGTISNVFWVQRGEIFTTPLNEGCIAGVMRKYMMDTLPKYGVTVRESPATISDIVNANEIFLTNVMRCLHWVAELQSRKYENTVSKKIFDIILSSLF